MNQPMYVCCMYHSYCDTNQQLTILNRLNWSLYVPTFLPINCFLEAGGWGGGGILENSCRENGKPGRIYCHFIVSLGPSKGWKQQVTKICSENVTVKVFPNLLKQQAVSEMMDEAKAYSPPPSWKASSLLHFLIDFKSLRGYVSSN